MHFSIYECELIYFSMYKMYTSFLKRRSRAATFIIIDRAGGGGGEGGGEGRGEGGRGEGGRAEEYQSWH
jgi:hypothetical protein